MTLAVIGAGLSRTGTFTLKLALEALGMGPCYHMAELAAHKGRAAQWLQVMRGGTPDWNDVYAGYGAAVDLPTCIHYRELAAHFPSARFVLTIRDAESWCDSFQATIFADSARRRGTADPLTEVMAHVARRCFADRFDRQGLVAGYDRHNELVRRTIPADRLLVFRVTEGWGPLCRFLGKQIPRRPFPRSNDRAAFNDLAGGL